MFIKGKYLLKREFRDDVKDCSYFVHYVLLNPDTFPKVARVKDFRVPVPTINANTIVRVNSNIFIDRNGARHCFYTDLEVLTND